jgi:hypothetical protein
LAAVFDWLLELVHRQVDEAITQAPHPEDMNLHCDVSKVLAALTSKAFSYLGECTRARMCLERKSALD